MGELIDGYDKEYTELVKTHKKQTSKQTSKQQKEVFNKEEEDKLDYLKNEKLGEKRAITSEISKVSKELYNKPYLDSKVTIDSKGNALCYSLKQVKYNSDLFIFEHFGGYN